MFAKFCVEHFFCIFLWSSVSSGREEQHNTRRGFIDPAFVIPPKMCGIRFSRAKKLKTFLSAFYFLHSCPRPWRLLSIGNRNEKFSRTRGKINSGLALTTTKQKKWRQKWRLMTMSRGECLKIFHEIRNETKDKKIFFEGNEREEISPKITSSELFLISAQSQENECHQLTKVFAPYLSFRRRYHFG